MTEARPWVEQLAGRRRLLAVAVAIAVLTSAAWLWVASGDGKVSYHPVAAGQAFSAGTATWKLVQLHSMQELPDGSRPVNGAVYVIADVEADLTGFAADGFCTWRLRAGEYEFEPTIGYFPSGPAVFSRCEPGTSGVVSTAFEVPAKLVDQVDGVVLGIPTQSNVLLAGRVG